MRPNNFYLQWHITERCNWHCKHCYQNEDYITDELTTEQLFDILKQYIFLIKKWNIPHNNASINLTGGEPLLRKDLFQLAEKLGQYSDVFHWGILSNGSLLTQDIVEKLKKCNIYSYQVSLEGFEETNDRIRGKGSFRKIINAIKLLVDAGIMVQVSLTILKENIKEIPELAEYLRSLGVHHLNTRRLVPEGRGDKLRDSVFTPQELRDYYQWVFKKNEEYYNKNIGFYIRIGCETSFINEDIELNKGSHKEHCLVYDGRALTVMPNGDVYPCRRLPIKIGNVLKQSLSDIYFNSEKLKDLRNLNNAHPFCQKCSNFHQCFGGAKCITYAYSGKLFVPDIQCPKAYKELKKPDFFNNFKDYVKKEIRYV